MFFVIGISIAFFLCIILISKKRKTLADKILVAWLFVTGIHLLFYYLNFTGRSFELPFLLGIDIPMPLLQGPFLFLYTGALTNQLLLKRKTWLLHFVPAMFSWLYLLIFFFTLSSEQKIFIYRHEGIGHETFMLINLIAIIASGILYILGSTLLLRRHRFAILYEFSYTENINLKWLQYLIYGLAAIWIAVFFGSEEITFSVVVFFVIFIGYFGIKQVGIFSYTGQLQQTKKEEIRNRRFDVNIDSYKEIIVQPITTGQTEEVTPMLNQEPSQIPFVENMDETDVDKRKYSKSGLSQEAAENLHKELIKLMETDKLYLESELTLSELAKRLNTHPNYLSQVINEKEGKNLYDYINTLRIEEFKKLISDPANQKYTILSLAYDCGFNSKSSFNRYFKKATGESPSEYMSKLNIEIV